MGAYEDRKAELAKLRVKASLEDDRKWWNVEGKYISRTTFIMYQYGFDRADVLVMPKGEFEYFWVVRNYGLLSKPWVVPANALRLDQARELYKHAQKNGWPIECADYCTSVLIPLPKTVDDFFPRNQLR